MKTDCNLNEPDVTTLIFIFNICFSLLYIGIPIGIRECSWYYILLICAVPSLWCGLTILRGKYIAAIMFSTFVLLTSVFIDAISIGLNKKTKDLELFLVTAKEWTEDKSKINLDEFKNFKERDMEIASTISFFGAMKLDDKNYAIEVIDYAVENYTGYDLNFFSKVVMQAVYENEFDILLIDKKSYEVMQKSMARSNFINILSAIFPGIKSLNESFLTHLKLMPNLKFG